MLYSLAEIDAVSKKAARGCGFTWGLSEEAGKATRYLASLSLPGPRLLASFLQQLDSSVIITGIPDVSETPWQFSDGVLCPLASGALLADSISRFESDEVIRLGRCATPLLVVAIVSRVLSRVPHSLCFGWSGVNIAVHANGCAISGDRQDALLGSVEQVSVTATDRIEPSLQTSMLPAEVDDVTWSELNALAFRTYVPSSDASRAGAGSKLSDND